MRQMRIGVASLIAGLVLAASALAAGCGNGDDKNAGRAQGSETAEAKAQYIARGDAVCDEFRAKRGKLVAALDRAGSSGDTKQLAKAVKQLGDASQKTYEDFAAIPKPSGDVAVLNSYLDAQHQLTRTLNRAADAYARGDVQGGNATLDSNKALADRSQSTARRYGFRICGSG